MTGTYRSVRTTYKCVRVAKQAYSDRAESEERRVGLLKEMQSYTDDFDDAVRADIQKAIEEVRRVQYILVCWHSIVLLPAEANYHS